MPPPAASRADAGQRRPERAHRRTAGCRRRRGRRAAACWPARATYKPYVAKRGEQYMSKEQLEHFQQILHELEAAI